MCDCRDCDNFKAKKREPQVGDRVLHKSYGGGLLLKRNVNYSLVDGDSFHGDTDKICIVFLDVPNHHGRLVTVYVEHVTVIE